MRLIKTVIKTANMSYVLHFSVQHTYYRLLERIRLIEVESCRHGRVDISSVSFNLACATYSCEIITGDDVNFVTQKKVQCLSVDGFPADLRQK